MAGARPIPGLEPDLAFREAAARAVEIRAEEIFTFSARALDTGDIEGVHDMRVATRRLRAVMELFAPCFPKRTYRRALGEVKALADTLGERRDPDVAIAALERVAGGLAAADRPGVESLISELRVEQAAANQALATAIAAAEQGELRSRLRALVAEARVA